MSFKLKQVVLELNVIDMCLNAVLDSTPNLSDENFSCLLYCTPGATRTIAHTFLVYKPWGLTSGT